MQARPDIQDREYVVISLDPATHTGYAVAQVVDDAATIIEHGTWVVDTALSCDGDVCLNAMDHLAKLLDRFPSAIVTIETFFFSARCRGGANLNVALRAAYWILLRQRGYSYHEVNPADWKKYVAGRAAPTKLEKKKWGTQYAKKFFVQQALWDRYKIRFANHMLSPKTGKPVAATNDHVDAVAMLIYYLGFFRDIKKVVSSVSVPPDIAMPVRKNVFVYSD